MRSIAKAFSSRPVGTRPVARPAKKRTTVKVVLSDDLQVLGSLDPGHNLVREVKAALSKSQKLDRLVLPAREKDRAAVVSSRTKRELSVGYRQGMGVIVTTSKRASTKGRSLTIVTKRGDEGEVIITGVLVSPTEFYFPPLPIELIQRAALEEKLPDPVEMIESTAFYQAWILGGK